MAPISYSVTRWQDDEFAKMAYSFVPVDCSGEVYEKLAAPVDGKIFFAGEVSMNVSTL
jgi:polyamine oxidase